MGVGKAVLCSHMPSSIVWSENGSCCGTIAYFVARIRREDLVQYTMSQTLSIWHNYLVVFVCRGIYHGVCSRICLAICHEIYHVGTKIKKFMVSQILCQAHPLKVSLTKIPRDHEPLSLIHHVGLHVGLSSIHEVFFGPLGLHLRVWSDLGCSLPFRPMRA